MGLSECHLFRVRGRPVSLFNYGSGMTQKHFEGINDNHWSNPSVALDIKYHN